jgi:hypothetical protein
MMRPLLPLPLVAATLVAASLVGCGNLSQEDLVFLGAIPAKEALEVRPAGARGDADAPGEETQAMEEQCAHELDVKCQARNIATLLNTVTFSLLALVDAVVEFPPSKREPGRRVWGPYFDFGNGTTSRFEMLRVDGGAAYEFCFHAVRDNIRDRDADDVTCDTDIDEDSGLTLILSGKLSPGSIDGARARFGRGTMLLQTARVPEFVAFGRTMTIDFDNTENETNINITVEGQPVFNGVAEREPLNYAFARGADGAGTFDFAMFANIHNAGEGRPLIERLELVAEWNADEAGVGRARVTEGELGDEVFIVDQCWDDALREVFLAADFTGDGFDRAALEGYTLDDEAQCVFPVSDVLLPDLE